MNRKVMLASVCVALFVMTALAGVCKIGNTEFDGEYPADILKADRNVNLELDIGPVTESGNDAVKWITDLSGRIPGMHAKPHGATAAGAAGDVQDWPKIISAARKAGVKWFVVECEKRKDTYDDVTASAAYLRPILNH